MHGSHFIGIVIIGVPVLTVMFFITPSLLEIDKIFLTTTTFLFSIFTGFFISHQASRFNAVREAVTSFDGKLSNIYRTSGHVNGELQSKIGEAIVNHYKLILESKIWDYHYVRKSVTLKSIHAYLDEFVDDKNVGKLSNQALGSIIKGLDECQRLRKRIVALREERIRDEQWLLIIFFVIILLFSVSALPSVGMIFASLMKATFVASIGAVLLILYRLNTLQFSESLMGEHSAYDVINIVKDK